MANHREKRSGRFQERVRSLRGDELVRAASGVLLQRGCREFRVEEVAAACGVAKGTCYRHFDTQPALLTAAVRYLDEALAGRLLSPPPGATKPRQVFEWAMLEAVDAEILTLAQRTGQAKLTPEALAGKAWPCCLGSMPCPHGGAMRSMEALRRSATAFAPGHAARTPICLAVLLTLPACYMFSLGHHSPLPNPRTVRSAARQLLKRLFS